ncbi:MAG: right-handed parallel beta-helix repeat-containing protein [Euryarchaeota archaeon]|nr:right-handed parallel beta-helix repeat-containing protein [Euryarchaeota archaeon]
MQKAQREPVRKGRTTLVITITLMVAAAGLGTLTAVDGPAIDPLARAAQDGRSATGSVSPEEASTAPDDPQAITGDPALLALAKDEGWSGTGEEADPIRIEALHIGADGRPALHLKDTSLHVLIIDNLILGDGTSDGVVLESVANVTVRDNHIEGTREAIVARGALSLTIATNDLVLDAVALRLVDVRDSSVVKNQVTLGHDGLLIEETAVGSSRGVTIEANRFEGLRGIGIRLEGSDHTVEKNRFTSGQGTGIEVSARSVAVLHNRFDNMTGVGVALLGAAGAVVRDNMFSDGAANAIRLKVSEEALIEGNRFERSPKSAVYGEDDHAMTVRDNDFGAVERAVVLHRAEDPLITLNRITGAHQAVDLSQVVGAVVSRNTFLHSSMSAINVFGGEDVHIEDNLVRAAKVYGVYVTGGAERSSVVRNIMHETPFGIFVSDAEEALVGANVVHGPGTTAITLVGTTGATARDNHVYHHAHGLVVGRGATATHVTGGLLRQDAWGIIIEEGAGKTTLDSVSVLQATVGVTITRTSGHTVRALDLRQNGQALLLVASHDNEVVHNRIEGNRLGLHFINATGNRVYDNLISNEHIPGDRNVILESSPGNLWNVSKRPGVNIIGGTWIAGNLWHDYTGADADEDGLGDVPYRPVPYSPLFDEVTQHADLPTGPLDMHPLVRDDHTRHDPLPYGVPTTPIEFPE